MSQEIKQSDRSIILLLGIAQIFMFTILKDYRDVIDLFPKIRDC